MWPRPFGESPPTIIEQQNEIIVFNEIQELKSNVNALQLEKETKLVVINQLRIELERLQREHNGKN